MASLLGIAGLLVANLPDESDGSAPVPANIGHAKKASGKVVNAGREAGEASETPPPPPPPPKATCGHDHPPLALETMKLDGDRYVIELGDGRIAELTLEPKAQEAARAVLAKAKAPRAAMVMMRPDGDVIALAGLDGGDTATPTPAPDHATTVWAPAASIFKVVTATALVDAGVSPKKRVCYHGGVRSVMASNLRDNRKRDRRCENLGYAVARSQNALIGKLAHKHLDKAKLEDAARALSMGSAPAFCADTEESTLAIPEEDLAFAQVAAGFWKTELSVLGGAIMTNTVQNGGMLVQPRLVRAIIDKDGNRHELEPAKPTRAISAKVANAVEAMMVGTIERGTGYKGFHDRKGRRHLNGVRVGGKTGTLTRASPSYMQYSWFVGFAKPGDPAKQTKQAKQAPTPEADAEPATVISVLLGNPPKWHLKAHTAARLALQKAK